MVVMVHVDGDVAGYGDDAIEKRVMLDMSVCRGSPRSEKNIED